MHKLYCAINIHRLEGADNFKGRLYSQVKLLIHKTTAPKSEIGKKYIKLRNLLDGPTSNRLVAIGKLLFI